MPAHDLSRGGIGCGIGNRGHGASDLIFSAYSACGSRAQRRARDAASHRSFTSTRTERDRPIFLADFPQAEGHFFVGARTACCAAIANPT
jgi:hypothetical protein